MTFSEEDMKDLVDRLLLVEKLIRTLRQEFEGRVRASIALKELDRVDA